MTRSTKIILTLLFRERTAIVPFHHKVTPIATHKLFLIKTTSFQTANFHPLTRSSPSQSFSSFSVSSFLSSSCFLNSPFPSHAHSRTQYIHARAQNIELSKSLPLTRPSFHPLFLKYIVLETIWRHFSWCTPILSLLLNDNRCKLRFRLYDSGGLSRRAHHICGHSITR